MNHTDNRTETSPFMGLLVMLVIDAVMLGLMWYLGASKATMGVIAIMLLPATALGPFFISNSSERSY